MAINIIVDAPDLEQSGKRGIRKLRRALAFSINESAKAGRDRFMSIHSQISTVRKKSFKNRMGIDKAKTSGKLRAKIWVGGKPYKGSEYASKDVYPQGVLVWIKRNAPTRFPHAFVRKRDRRKKFAPIFQRTGPKRFPLKDPVKETGIGAADIVRPKKGQVIAHIIKTFGSRFAAERNKLGI